MSPLGLAAFESLRAEDESWLAEYAYVLPAEFELMAGARSIIVYGQPGSGKTALRRALEYRATSSTPKRLVVRWRPSLPSDMPAAGTPAARKQFAQVLNACALALLEHLAYSPKAYGQAPEWAQRTLTWFIRHYVGGDLQTQVEPLLDKVDDAGRSLVRVLVTQPTGNLLSADAPIDTIIARLVEALSRIGISGVWVMADGIEGLAEDEPDRLTAVLDAFLSSLAYFEQAPFLYKLMLPISLQPKLDATGAVARRRVFLHQLRWTPEQLTRIVERRIALAVGEDDFKLADLYSPPDRKTKLPAKEPGKKSPGQPALHPVQAWLMGCGGWSPRGWLTFASPLVAEYLERRARGERGALTHEQWLAARRRVPLSLSFDEKSGLMQVGWRTIERLPPVELSVLRYLIAKQGQVCTKEELYSKAYLASHEQIGSGSPIADIGRPGTKEPATPRSRKRSPSGYADIIDTVLWRLREAIEPDPEEPVFIQTFRGQGVVLNIQPFEQIMRLM